jgi:4'-phosphopantetheinyl transferase
MKRQFKNTLQDTPELQWLTPPEQLILANDEVHIWRLYINSEFSNIQYLKGILSNEERTKAEGFYFKIDQWRYIIVRAILRIILAKYLCLEPEQIRFNYGTHDKPALSDVLKTHRVNFNLSHSQNIALYVIVCDREVGIDIENIRTDLDVLGIAEHWFSQREAAVIRELSSDAQKKAFFTIWTRKEAYLKAKGVGLAQLNGFEVLLHLGELTILMSSEEDSHEPSLWKLEDLAVDPDYAATVAVEGKTWTPKFWQWSPIYKLERFFF